MDLTGRQRVYKEVHHMDEHRVNHIQSIMSHSASRRRIAALMAGAIGVTLAGARNGVASQEANGQALLYRGGQSIGTCSGHADDVDLPIVGFVNYHLLEDGLTLKVNVHYKAALPNRTYGWPCDASPVRLARSRPTARGSAMERSPRPNGCTGVRSWPLTPALSTASSHWITSGQGS